MGKRDVSRLRTRESENRLVERMRAGTEKSIEWGGGGDCTLDGDVWMVSEGTEA